MSSSALRLAEVRPFCKWGRWQRLRPDVACGLNAASPFSFTSRDRVRRTDDHQRQLLVAASPDDDRRHALVPPQFDQGVAEEAKRAGAEYLDRTLARGLVPPRRQLDSDGEREGRPVRVSACFVIDASGPLGFLHRALCLDEDAFSLAAATQGLDTHSRRCRAVELSGPSASTACVSARRSRAGLRLSGRMESGCSAPKNGTNEALVRALNDAAHAADCAAEVVALERTCLLDEPAVSF